MNEVRMSEAERDTLLTPCACGHDLNDHGSLTGCWACGEVEADPECRVTCEALIAERVGLIVAGRTMRSEAEVLLAAAEAWRNEGRGVMFNRNGDNLTPEQRVGKWMRDRAAALSAQEVDEPRVQPCPAGTTQGLTCQLSRGHAGDHVFGWVWKPDA